MILQCGKRPLDLSSPKIMGILNVTPDSFSDGGQAYSGGKVDLSFAVRRAEAMVKAGAAIIDVGGESTRPGASAVLEQEELDRVAPVVEAICQALDVVISVDTSSPVVMTTSARLGAGLINDVRALRRPGALTAAATTGLPVCLMHMQGEPLTMQHDPRYDNVVEQVKMFFAQRIDECVSHGLSSAQILLDPGIGFGKADEHNLALLKKLQDLRVFGCPLLVGLSRKSMIGRLLGRELPERLPGSLGFGLIALQQGASILRVHDVAATADMVKIFALTA